MEIDLDVVATLVAAAIVLLVGRRIIGVIRPLRTYSIPEPVVGGLLAAIVVALLRGFADIQIGFDTGLQAPLMLAFFATIGLSADIRMLLRGGRQVVVFLLVVIGLLLLQNVIGVAAALALDLHPLAGLLSGSITLSGGHGTGAAYATRFTELQNLQGAMELAMACATFGLVLGGVVGGPVGERLIKRHKLQPAAVQDTALPGQADSAQRVGVGAKQILETMLLVWLCMLVGRHAGDLMEGAPIKLPSFVWVLFTGIVLRNLLTLGGRQTVDQAGLDAIGGVALALFLAMALMSLRLLDLVGLALPILAILAVQTVVVALYASFVTFKVMGASYDAAILAGGHCGFALGATPTAIANMQALCARHGYAPLAFILVPIVGAFLVDITNAIVIQGFLALPLVSG